jgi:hypothetical protein
VHLCAEAVAQSGLDTSSLLTSTTKATNAADYRAHMRSPLLTNCRFDPRSRGFLPTVLPWCRPATSGRDSGRVRGSPIREVCATASARSSGLDFSSAGRPIRNFAAFRLERSPVVPEVTSAVDALSRR